MADNFIGLTVAVTLNAPPNLQAQGLVANVAGRTLYLQDVFFPATGHRLPSYNIDGSQIADIQIPSSAYPHSPSNRPNPQNISTSVNLKGGAALAASDSYLAQAQSSALLPAEPPSRQSFVDPAILSFAKKPTPIRGLGISEGPSRTSEVAAETPATPAKQLNLGAQLPQNGSPFVGEPRQRQDTAETPKKKNHVTATLTEPFNELRPPVESDSQDDSDGRAQNANKGRGDSVTTIKPNDTVPREKKDKKKRRGVKKKNKPAQISAVQDQTFDGLPTSPEVFKRKGKAEGKNIINPKTGWRATPILEETPRVPGLIGGNVAQAAAISSNKKNKQQKALEREARQNGWATEDATDIQELGDFDFAGNLSRFDKRSVFNQIRNEDTTADEDRLVSHNRLPQAKPGTNKGKNFHPSENVLEQSKPTRQSSGWSSSSLESIPDDTYSRRAASRASTKRVPLRTSSLPQDHHDAPSVISTRTSRPPNSRFKKHSIPSHPASSPKPASFDRPTPPLSTSPYLASAAEDNDLPQPAPPTSHRTSPSIGTLRLTQPASLPCPTLSAATLSALEAYAATQHALPESLLAEAAARGIVDAVLNALNPGGRRLARDNPNAAPVVVVLVGRHARGGRAVAAARWLCARGLRVLVGVLGYEETEEMGQGHDRDVAGSAQHDWAGGGNYDEEAEVKTASAEEKERHAGEAAFTVQLDTFIRLGGRVYGWAALERRLKRLDAPPELIVDAIVGRAGWNAELEADQRPHQPHDIRHPDPTGADAATTATSTAARRADALAMVAWANRSRAECVAVEVPTGVDADTGAVRILEGEPLLLRPRLVVTLGAPLRGLLGALRRGEGEGWRLCVVDVGLDGVWKRAAKRAVRGGLDGLVGGDGGDGGGMDAETVRSLAELGVVGGRGRVEFGARWVVAVSFVEGEVGAED
ncbi:MAG: hypothetical protein M1822_001915 [Bathelium mastoideum]|nr:MAG: hypothetical protein M1822_001915 [Bathelium mastoideum]